MNKNTKLGSISISCNTTPSSFIDYSVGLEHAYSCINFLHDPLDPKYKNKIVLHIYLPYSLLELTIEEFLIKYSLGLIGVTQSICPLKAQSFITYLQKLIAHDKTN